MLAMGSANLMKSVLQNSHYEYSYNLSFNTKECINKIHDSFTKKCVKLAIHISLRVMCKFVHHLLQSTWSVFHIYQGQLKNKGICAPFAPVVPILPEVYQAQLCIIVQLGPEAQPEFLIGRAQSGPMTALIEYLTVLLEYIDLFKIKLVYMCGHTYMCQMIGTCFNQSWTQKRIFILQYF